MKLENSVLCWPKLDAVTLDLLLVGYCVGGSKKSIEDTFGLVAIVQKVRLQSFAIWYSAVKLFLLLPLPQW